MKMDGLFFYELQEIIVLYYSSLMGEMRYTYMVMVGNPEGKRSLERPRYIERDNIKIHRTDIRG